MNPSLHIGSFFKLESKNMKQLKSIQFLPLFLMALGLSTSGCSNDEGNNFISVPLVSSISPADNDTNIGRNNTVEISFNTPMDAATINSSTVFVIQGMRVVPGVVSYTATMATFTPTDNWLALTSYIVTVTTGAKTLAGRAVPSDVVTGFTTGGSISPLSSIDLGTAMDYVILAKTGINNSSTSAITGDLGLSPAATSYIKGLAVTDEDGYGTSGQVTGKLYAADMTNQTAANLTTTVSNMIAAYTDAASRTLPDFIELGAGNIGGKTLTAGLYKWANNVAIPSNIVISGNVNDVWIFQIEGNLSMSSAVSVTLVGGAQANNIYWQVGGQATIGSTSHFEGIILSRTSITLQTGASLNGQMLAQTAVTLDNNVIEKR
jgi:hypothetical protein